MLYAALEKASQRINKVLEYLVSFLVVTCAAALFFQVIYRFIIIKFVSFSFPFTEEYARYALIWLTYLSIGICYKEGTMASVNLLFDKLNGKSKLALYILTRLIVLIFLIAAMTCGIRYVNNNQIFRSATLKIPGLFLQSAPFVCSVLLMFEWLVETAGVLTGRIEPFGHR